MDRVTKTQKAMKRSMLGTRLTEKKIKARIRRRTKEKMFPELARMKWNCAGHVVRYQDGRCNKSVHYSRLYLGHRRPAQNEERWWILEEDFYAVGCINA